MGEKSDIPKNRIRTALVERRHQFGRAESLAGNVLPAFTFCCIMTENSMRDHAVTEAQARRESGDIAPEYGKKMTSKTHAEKRS